jgi:hypothetical protein
MRTSQKCLGSPASQSQGVQSIVRGRDEVEEHVMRKDAWTHMGEFGAPCHIFFLSRLITQT